MFGDKEICGNSEIKVNSKKGFKLPDYTFAEPGDNLAILYLYQEDEYILVKEEIIEEKYYKLKNVKENTDDIEKYKIARSLIRFLCHSYQRLAIVDDKNNIKLSVPSGTIFKCEGKGKQLVMKRITNGEKVNKKI